MLGPGIEKNTEKKSNNWQLIRDVIGFQFKLALDGIRDVLLSPISIGAALIGIVTRPDEPDKYYRELLKFGSKSDHWINLFDTQEHANVSSDEYINKVEDLLVGEYNKGGVVRSIKNHADDMIHSVQKGFTPQNQDDLGVEPSADKKKNPK